MAKPYRLLEVEQAHNTPLDELIPALVNAMGSQKAAADHLGVSQATISTWLKEHNYIPKVTYIKGEPSNASSSERISDPSPAPSSL